MSAVMKQVTHTPGPWYADEYNNIFSETVPADFATGSKPRRMLVAEAHVSFNPAPVSHANARLIAAAPDLAEALLAMRKRFDFEMSRGYKDLVDAALAKAGL